MLSAKLIKRDLKFAFPAGTSRGVLHEKPTWYLQIWKDDAPEIIGTGECSPIWGLSPEKESEYESLLEKTLFEINNFEKLLSTDLLPYPSIYFGVETALMDLFKGGKKIFFQNSFTEGHEGIQINGLVWMNTIDEMYTQAVEKSKQGFTCIKLKIGSLKLDEEINLLKQLRNEFGNNITLRVDANGAFDYSTAKEILTQLKSINIHSIEQPLKAGDPKLEDLCKQNIIPIALDEELIGKFESTNKEELIARIRPQYLVLKPSLHGGFMGCRQWINAAEKNKCGWWMTSALESNIGLNAIAQYTFQTKNKMHHGLGTGKIYTNNIESPLNVKEDKLWFDNNAQWGEI
jgi:O-succinylbenzoate synthase